MTLELARKRRSQSDLIRELVEVLELAKHKAEQIRDGQCNPVARAKAIIYAAAPVLAKAKEVSQ